MTSPAQRAKIGLSPDQLASMLDLPDGTHITSLRATSDPDTVWVHITGPDLAEVPSGAESPILAHLQVAGVAAHVPYDGRLEVWRADDGYRWRVRSRANGQIVAGPQEGYTDEDHAVKMGESITGLTAMFVDDCHHGDVDE